MARVLLLSKDKTVHNVGYSSPEKLDADQLDFGRVINEGLIDMILESPHSVLAFAVRDEQKKQRYEVLIRRDGRVVSENRRQLNISLEVTNL